ncbi:MAG: AMP-binding protein [Antricoccus sp.]
MGLPELSMRTLKHAFDTILAKDPDKVAHIAYGVEWTFAESYRRSLRITRGLAQLPIARQQTVATMLDNSIDSAHTFFAIALGGFIEVPINTAYKGTFLRHILNDSAATVLIVEDRYVDRINLIATELDTLRTIIVRGSDFQTPAVVTVRSFADLTANAPAGPIEVEPGELIAYMYTSGTTGVSKGVLVSHAHAYTYASREDFDRPRIYDRILVALPMFHLAGQWYGLYQGLIHGCTCIIEPGFSVRKFWPLVRDQQITYTLLLGAMAELMAQQEPTEADADNPLDTVVMAPLASDVQRFADRFAIAPQAVYGMTEIGAVMNGGTDSPLRSGEAGAARRGYTLRVVRPDGSDTDPGEVGELLVRPDEPLVVTSGYHNLPEKSAETIHDGWVHTGDAFSRDDDGHYYFADRIKDALRRRGENISSFEVETVINAHPSVYECAVVAVPSDLTEDEIKAVIVPRPNTQIDHVALISFLVDRLPYFMVPRYIEVVSELPKTPTQKISKHILRASALTGDVWDRDAAGIEVRR